MAAKKRVKLTHKLPEKFTSSEILIDLVGNKWKVGSQIGVGGFGAIYNASSLGQPKMMDYVAKIEPFANGPLFTEMHFYQRCCKKEQIDEWIQNHADYHKLLSLAVPFYIASGSHILSTSQNKYRFLIMEKFGADLEKTILNPKIVRENSPDMRKFVCYLSIRLLYALEYIHDQGYVHSDIKASNIMSGIAKSHLNQIFLLDYGLVSKYKFEPHSHKEFKIDPRKGHDGTIEFTSLDAHKGTDPSRRSDLEVLGYNLLKWTTGKLPWEKTSAAPDWVANEKTKYLKNIPLLMKTCYKNANFPTEIQKYFQYFTKLKYDETPDYNYLREDLFNKTLKDVFKTNYRDNFLSITPSKNLSKNFNHNTIQSPSTSTLENSFSLFPAPDTPKHKKASSTVRPLPANILKLAQTSSKVGPKKAPSMSLQEPFPKTTTRTGRTVKARVNYREKSISDTASSSTSSTNLDDKDQSWKTKNNFNKIKTNVNVKEKAVDENIYLPAFTKFKQSAHELTLKTGNSIPYHDTHDKTLKKNQSRYINKATLQVEPYNLRSSPNNNGSDIFKEAFDKSLIKPYIKTNINILNNASSKRIIDLRNGIVYNRNATKNLKSISPHRRQAVPHLKITKLPNIDIVCSNSPKHISSIPKTENLDVTPCFSSSQPVYETPASHFGKHPFMAGLNQTRYLTPPEDIPSNILKLGTRKSKHIKRARRPSDQFEQSLLHPPLLIDRGSLKFNDSNLMNSSVFSEDLTILR